MTMRFFVDECLSPTFSSALQALGQDAIHPLHTGRRGNPDHVVVANALREDRIIITENIRDFKILLACESIHPGLIALPQASVAQGFQLILSAISQIVNLGGNPMDEMVNKCIEFDAGGSSVLLTLSKAELSD